MSRLVRSRFDDALPQFERVLSFNDLEHTRIYAAALNNAGICLARLGQFDKALALQQRAVEIHERSGRRLELMQALGELGTTHFLQRRDLPGDALSCSGRWRSPPRRVVGRRLGVGVATWRRRSSYSKNWDEAAKYNDEARRLNPPDRPAKLVLNTATEAQIAAARGDAARPPRFFDEVLAASANEPALRGSRTRAWRESPPPQANRADAATHFEAALQRSRRRARRC